MGNIFGGGKKSPAPPPAPAPLPVPPTPEVAAVEADKKLKKKRAAISEGSKSIYTSPLGIAGQADVLRKTLLGQ